jgi:hypothetical protein
VIRIPSAPAQSEEATSAVVATGARKIELPR